MFYTTKSFFTIFFISVLLLSFGTFAEANGDEDEEESSIEFIGDPVIDDFTLYRMTEDTLTGKREWIDSVPEVTVGIGVYAYGIGKGQGTLKNVTILGATYEIYQKKIPTKVGETGIYEKGSKKGKGWYNKGTDNTWVKTVISRELKKVPRDELKDSYDWSSEGSITLTHKAWKKTVSENFRLSWPLQISGTMGKSGTWEYQGTVTRSAPKGTQGVHKVTLKPVNSLSVSFNKTTFTSDEELVVSVSMDRLTSTDLRFGNQISSFMGKKG